MRVDIKGSKSFKISAHNFELKGDTYVYEYEVDLGYGTVVLEIEIDANVIPSKSIAIDNIYLDVSWDSVSISSRDFEVDFDYDSKEITLSNHIVKSDTLNIDTFVAKGEIGVNMNTTLDDGTDCSISFSYKPNLKRICTDIVKTGVITIGSSAIATAFDNIMVGVSFGGCGGGRSDFMAGQRFHCLV